MATESTGMASQSLKEKAPCGIAEVAWPPADAAAPARNCEAAPPAWSSLCWKWSTSRESATAPRAW